MRELLLLPVLVLAGCVSPQDVTPDDAGALAALPPIPSFGDVVRVGVLGNEPVIRVAPDGTIYVAALHYVYVSTDGGKSFRQVDFKGLIPVYASDTALAVSPEGRAYVTFDWPYAGHTAVCATSTRGETWACNPLVVPGATDRMWIAAPTASDVYLITGQTLNRPTFVVSHDKGETWTITHFDYATQTQGADLAWDPLQKRILQAASGPGGWGVRAYDTEGKFLGFTTMKLTAPAGSQTVAVDWAGTWWATACAPGGGCKPAVAWSKDQGQTWNVTALPFAGKLTFMPFIAAGAANRVASIWYETRAASRDAADAEWQVSVSQTVDGSTWETTTLTPKPVHTGPMCRSISCLGDARFAGDFLGLAFDPADDLHATWNRQTGEKPLPVGQVPTEWEQVEYARTLGGAAR